MRLDKAQGTLTFPAVLNMDQGPMEYLLVSSSGKLHESILRTEAQPYLIHTAMLLLGAKGPGTNSLPAVPRPKPDVPGAAADDPSQPIAEPSKEILRGEDITIELSWRANGKEVHRAAQELVFNAETKSAMRNGRWVYNGSRVADGTFFAQVTGSLVSLITDPDALVNNVGTGHENDKIWMPNPSRLPPWNTPLQVTMKLGLPPGTK